MPFLQNFQGFDVDLVAEFLENFEADFVTIRGYTISMTKEVIINISRFSMHGMDLLT